MSCPFAQGDTAPPQRSPAPGAHQDKLKESKSSHIARLFAEIASDLKHHGIGHERIASQVRLGETGSVDSASLLTSFIVLLMRIAGLSLGLVLLLGVALSDSSMFLPPVRSCFEQSESGSDAQCIQPRVVQRIEDMQVLAGQGHPLIVHRPAVTGAPPSSNTAAGEAALAQLQLYADHRHEYHEVRS